MTDHLDWETLNDLVDGRLTEASRRVAELHAGECASCAEALSGLRAALAGAAVLRGPVEPPADLWAAVQATIESRKVAPIGVAGRAPRGWWVTPPRAAAAALLLVALSAGATVGISRLFTGRAPALPVLPVAMSWQVAEHGYQSSVLELRSQLAAQADRLAPATIAAIEQSLATIDVAIAEAREALLRDPANAALPELLASNYRQKIDLLRRATRLATS